MLEGTWKHDALHESLAQHLLPDFIWGNSKLHFLGTGKRRLPSRGCGEGTFCLL